MHPPTISYALTGRNLLFQALTGTGFGTLADEGWCDSPEPPDGLMLGEFAQWNRKSGMFLSGALGKGARINLRKAGHLLRSRYG